MKLSAKTHRLSTMPKLMSNENGGGKVCHGSGGIVPQLAE